MQVKLGGKIVFGYVKPRRGDLRIKEYDFYKAVYCGLCHHQKKLSRRLRYMLSYDMVLLALLRLGAVGERACFLKQRCPVHPVKGCLAVASSESLAYTASVSAILLYGKLQDDSRDEKGIRRLFAKMMAKSAKKAMRHAPILALEETTAQRLLELSACEARSAESVYEGAEIFGKLLGEVFAYDGKGELAREKTVALYEIGYRVGRLIYILDKKTGAYNPFVLSKEDTESDAFRDRLVIALDMELVQASVALDLLDIADGGIYAILKNLLKLGLGDVMREVIYHNKRAETIQKESRKAYEL